MSLNLSTEAFARRSARRPWITIGIWVVVFIIAVFLRATLFDDVITTKFEPTNSPESKVGDRLLEEHLTGPKGTNEVVVVQSQTLTVDDQAFRQKVNAITTALSDLGPDIIRPESLINYYLTNAAFLVSEDRQTTIIPFTMAGDFDDGSDHIEEVSDAVEGFRGDSSLKVLMVGQATIGQDFQEVAQDGLEKGEMFGAPIALLILILVLGALVAAVIPLIMAIVAIVVALGVASLVGQLFELSFFVENMIFMIGLAVGIDYSLFVVSRYRVEQDRGLEKLEAIARAGGTANRTVVFSGMTVVVGLLGMLIVPSNVFIGIGVAAILVVVASVFAALTLLPAILSLLGDRINKFSLPFVGRSRANLDYDQSGGLWGGVARGVMGQPIISLVLAAGLLVAALVWFFDINTGAAGVSSFPDGIESKEGFLILDEKFSAGEVTPAEIVIEGNILSEPVQESVERLKLELSKDESFSDPRPIQISGAGDVGVLTVPVSGDPTSKETQDAIRRLRNQHVPAVF